MEWPRVQVIHEGMDMVERVETLTGVLSPENANRRQTVHICADIDLTGVGPIVIGDCRRLIAPKQCARSPKSRGPCVYTDRMYTIDNDDGRGELFRVEGDNVLISGFQLKGPSPDIGMGEEQKEKGILIKPPALGWNQHGEQYALPPIRNIVISNMEIYHWSGVGVQVNDSTSEKYPQGRLNGIWPGPGAVRVVGCYFHHNRHGPGEGYGVNSTFGAYVTIEQNVFDENRHAIAGGPANKARTDFSGYTVRDNLILPGGGVHIYYDAKKAAGYAAIVGGILFGIIGGIFGGLVGAALGAALGAAVAAALAGGAVALGLVGWQTHQIDMHGTESDFRVAIWPKGQACCGTAGETLIIERNTVLYDGHRTRWWLLNSGPAIKIRGNPTDKALATGNVFRHREGDAIHQNGEVGSGPTNPVLASGNTYNAYNYAFPNYWGKGDFYGAYDNPFALEDFMATGVTWWARSPVTEQWRYLNTMPEQINELHLEKADDDAIWDVTRRYTPPGELESYSKGGRTPWQPLIRMPPVPPQ